MRIEERGSNKYVKKPDVVDTYVLRIIQRYFETNEEAILNSREDIINEALRRVRPEVVFSIQKTVVEETKKYAQEELDNAIDAKLADIVQELRDEVYKMQAARIGKAEFSLTIPAVTYDINMPSDQSIHATKDLVDIYVNGSIQTNYKFVTDGNNIIKQITFEPDLLLPQDVVTVKCIILHQS